MNLLRLHWFDIGIGLALITGILLLVTHPVGLGLLLWISLITLFVHQFEEYRYPGYFPGMMNTVLFASTRPDRFPLNSQTSLIVNVLVGWLAYFLAALFYRHAVWLAIATLLVSVGNVVAHVILFNIKGKTRYNPGMLTAVVLFLPLSVYCFSWIIGHHAATAVDWVVGLALGAAMNYIGILKLIDWLKDADTAYIFPPRFLPPRLRAAKAEQP